MSDTALVIGGAGFLGQHLVERLIQDKWKVKVFDMAPTWNGNEEVEYYRGNLCKPEDLYPALDGVESVFHCASPSAALKDKNLFYKVNYEGTRNIIKCCRDKCVKKLILTSSCSVVYSGTDIHNGTEEIPYPADPLDYYTETKALQEKIVLGANDNDLFTSAIRPHSIFGPKDPQLVPVTVETARQGKMKFMIGDGKNLSDFTYVDNVVQGLLLAEKNLGPGRVANGQIYNITNDEPVPFWSFLSRIIVGLGYEAPKYHLPYRLVYALACLMAFITWIISPLYTLKATFTPSRVALAGTTHYYSCTKAKSQLGYTPIVSLDDAISKTLESFQHLRADNS